MEAIAGVGLRFLHNLADGRVGEGDEQDAVLKGVVRKDVGKAGRDDTANPVVEEGP